VLLDVLRESGERLLSQQATPSLPDRVRALLRHEPDLHGVDAKHIAKVLKLNVRSFRRQLVEAHAPWTSLLDEARHQIACVELRRGSTILELTERLGFSEPSAFNRAFKRWTGTTPAKYSQQGASAASSVRVAPPQRSETREGPAQEESEP
jgi:AraC-like DNA-binding protein